MCDPVIGAVVMGGQQALGIMGQNKALGARNKNRALLYGRDLNRIHGEHLINVSNYYLKGADAEIAWSDNALQASQATDAQQVVINEALATALRATEADYTKMISDPRIAKSLERSGRSARRIATAGRAALGRASAQRAGKMDDARDKAAIFLAEIEQKRRTADRDALWKIGLTPQRAADPPKPVFEKGPSLFSSLMKIALAAGQGYMMGKSLQGAVPKTPPVDAVKTSSIDLAGVNSNMQQLSEAVRVVNETVPVTNRGLLVNPLQDPSVFRGVG